MYIAQSIVMYNPNEVPSYGLQLELIFCRKGQVGSHTDSTFQWTSLEEERSFKMQINPLNLKPLAPTTTSGHTP